MIDRHPPRPTCFAQRLVLSDGGWYWRDGRIEPRVTTVASASAGFAADSGPHEAVVAVPFLLAEFYDPLRWVSDAARAGDFDCEVGTECGPGGPAVPVGRPRPARVASLMTVLVPVARWSAWCATCDVLPVWSPADQVALERRAFG